MILAGWSSSFFFFSLRGPLRRRAHRIRRGVRPLVPVVVPAIRGNRQSRFHLLRQRRDQMTWYQKGRQVEQIQKDLVPIAVGTTRKQATKTRY